MSDVGFTPFELPDTVDEHLGGAVPPAPAEVVEMPRRRGPRPGSKRGPRAVPVAAPPSAGKAPKAKADVPIALMAEVFGALSLPEAQAVGQLVEAFSPESQKAIASAVLKLAGEK